MAGRSSELTYKQSPNPLMGTDVGGGSFGLPDACGLGWSKVDDFNMVLIGGDCFSGTSRTRLFFGRGMGVACTAFLLS